MRSRSLKKEEENKTGVRTAGENDSRQVGQLSVFDSDSKSFT